MDRWLTCFLGRMGGATTFASAKVKDAIGRIGIFNFIFSVSELMVSLLCRAKGK